MMRSMAARRHRLLPVLLVAAAAVVAGMATAIEPLAGVLLAVCAVSALASLQWRIGVKALLVALPFAGVPVFIAGAAGLVMRDLFIVAPLYVGFGIAMLRDREPLLPPMHVAWAMVAGFAVLVLLYVVVAPTLLAGVIGVRVWLAYLPMAAIGYRYVRQISDFESVLKLTAVIGLVPAALAIAEWVLATRTGSFGPFESLYGAVDRGPYSFVVFSMPTGTEHLMIPRVPSTFTNAGLYYGFSVVAFAAGLAMALRRGGDWWSCAVVLACGALASGVRTAYVVVPGVAVLAVLLMGPTRKQVALLALGALATAGIGAVFAGPWLFVEALAGHVEVTLRFASRELRESLRITGHGTGWDTNSALRYSGVSERRFIESWYAKAALELGIPGLIMIVGAFAAIAVSLLRSMMRADAASRRLAAPVVSVLLLTMGVLFKAPFIDVDPLNVYFWLLIGMTAGALGASQDVRPAGPAATKADAGATGGVV